MQRFDAWVLLGLRRGVYGAIAHPSLERQMIDKEPVTRRTPERPRIVHTVHFQGYRAGRTHRFDRGLHHVDRATAETSRSARGYPYTTSSTTRRSEAKTTVCTRTGVERDLTTAPWARKNGLFCAGFAGEHGTTRRTTRIAPGAPGRSWHRAATCAAPPRVHVVSSRAARAIHAVSDASSARGVTRQGAIHAVSRSSRWRTRSTTPSSEPKRPSRRRRGNTSGPVERRGEGLHPIASPVGSCPYHPATR